MTRRANPTHARGSSGLETAPPDQIRKLWVEEALRRRDEVRSGKVKPVPGEEVMAEARRLAKR